MKITNFQIEKYRSIENSGRVELLDNLTCIVGKNQSGKTALLKALFKFNPRDPNPYDLRREWPRGQRNLQTPNQVVCTTWFHLEPEEVGELAALTTEQVKTDKVVVTRDYAGQFEVYFPEQPTVFPEKIHPNSIDSACQHLALPAARPVSDRFLEVAQACIDEAKQLAREGRFSDLAQLRPQHKAALEAAYSGGNPQRQHEINHVNTHDQCLQQLEAALSAAPSMQREAHDFIIQRLPIFIYMDDYLSFEGTAKLEEVRRRRDSRQMSPADETFLMILDLAKLNLDSLILSIPHISEPSGPLLKEGLDTDNSVW
jgi:hypothetical protein